MNVNNEYDSKVNNVKKRKNNNNNNITTSNDNNNNNNNNNSLFVQIPWGNVLLYYSSSKVSLQTFLSLRSTCTGIPFDVDLSIEYHIIPWIYTILVQSNILLIPDSINNWKYSSFTNTTNTTTTTITNTNTNTNSSSEIIAMYQSIYNLLQKCRNQPLYEYTNNMFEQNNCRSNTFHPDNDNSIINGSNVLSSKSLTLLSSLPILSNTNDISIIKVFFHIVRIIHSIPQQIAICFSGKYGRHCIPFQKENHCSTAITSSDYSDNNNDYDNNDNNDYNDDDEKIKIKLPLQLYPLCTDANKKRCNATCENCKFRIPTISKEIVTSTNMDERFVKIAVQTKNNKSAAVPKKQQIEYLKTDQYFPTCLPNIPNDIQCPICCFSGNTITPTSNSNTSGTTNRTVQLTEVSYKVDSELYKMFPYLMSLTFTPIIPVTKKNSNNNNSNDNDNDNTADSSVLSDNDHDSSTEEEDDDDDDNEEEQRYQIERRKRLGLSTNCSNNDNTNNSSPTAIDNNKNASPVVDDIETTGQSSTTYKEFVTVQEEFFNPYYSSQKVIRTNNINSTTKNDYITTKHAIAIHCTKCYQFGLLAPATVCSSLNRYYNNSKNRNNNNSTDLYCQSIRTNPTTVTVPDKTSLKRKVDDQQQEHVFTCGGVLVRTMCSNMNCSRALECTMCRTMFFNNIQQQQQQSKKRRQYYNDSSSSSKSRGTKRKNVSAATIGFNDELCFACYTDKYL